MQKADFQNKMSLSNFNTFDNKIHKKRIGMGRNQRQNRLEISSTTTGANNVAAPRSREDNAKPVPESSEAENI